VAAGGRVVVWCSNKNRKAVATKLHTNFKLDNDGEYLALVRPDGLTVEHAYSLKYPPQFPNGTYGTNQATVSTTVLAEGAPGKAKTAADAADFAANFVGWNSAVNFDDSSWVSGNGGFGTGGWGPTLGTTISAPNFSFFLRYNVQCAKPRGSRGVAAQRQIRRWIRLLFEWHEDRREICSGDPGLEFVRHPRPRR
jgi:hypothetical protein